MSLAGDLALVALVTLAIRSFNLLRFPLWWDESIYIRWAMDIWEQHTRESLMIPIVDDGKQPLFMWLAGGLGIVLKDPLLGARLVSVLAGVAGVVAVYLAGRWLAGRDAGLIAGLLYAVAPFTILFDRLALADGLLNATGSWVLALSILIATKEHTSRRTLLLGGLLGLVLGAAIWTKMPALFMLSFPVLCAMFLTGRKRLVPATRSYLIAFAIFALFGLLLAMVPGAERLVSKTDQFTLDGGTALPALMGIWTSHVVTYWEWFQGYLPAPLSWLVLLAVVWGLVRHPRLALVLIGCWLAMTLPIVIAARKQYTSRYVMPGIVPLLLLTACMLSSGWFAGRAWLKRRYPNLGGRRPLPAITALLLMLATLAPSIYFDYGLFTDPEGAVLQSGDRLEYVTGIYSGYGFGGALELAKRRVTELTSQGQPVILITDAAHGLPMDGVKIYMRGVPNVFHYIDNHLIKDPEGFPAAWRSHHVPIVIIGNDGVDHLDAFEQAVPQAKRIGYFTKPGDNSSFRVYEVGPDDL